VHIALDDLLRTRFITRYVAFLAELAEAYGQIGKIANAQAVIDEALDRCHRNEEFWYIAEILRIKGEIVIKANETSDSAEELFRIAQVGELKKASWSGNSALR
jgi:hypothetical protein